MRQIYAKVIISFLFLMVISSATWADKEKHAVSEKEISQKPPVITWEYKFSQPVKDIDISPGARWIAVATQGEDTEKPPGYVYLFKKNGKLVWKKPVEYGPVAIDIAAGEKVKGGVKVAAMTLREGGWGHLVVFDKKGDILWATNYVSDYFDMSEDGEYILTSGDESWFTILYDGEGNKLWEKSDEIIQDGGFGRTAPYVHGFPFISNRIEEDNDDEQEDNDSKDDKDGDDEDEKDNRGVVLYGLEPGGKGLVYNVKGELLWRTEMNEQWIEAVTANGKYFLIGGEDYPGVREATKYSLVDKNRTPVFTINKPCSISKVQLSDNGETTLVGIYTDKGVWPVFYNKKGNSLPTDIEWGGVMSGNGKYYFYEKDGVIVSYDIYKGIKISGVSVDLGVLSSGDMRISEKGKYIIACNIGSEQRKKLLFIKNTAIDDDEEEKDDDNDNGEDK